MNKEYSVPSMSCVFHTSNFKHTVTVQCRHVACGLGCLVKGGRSHVVCHRIAYRGTYGFVCCPFENAQGVLFVSSFSVSFIHGWTISDVDPEARAYADACV